MNDFVTGHREGWKWTLMIMQPEFISIRALERAIAQVRAKKDPAGLAKLRFESFREGSCARTLHLGAFAEEGPTIKRVH
jgi:hypothetical protein